jgi:hypothetical protein
LQIPATSASERFFSKGANIVSKNRNRLSKSNFEKILCLKSWGLEEKIGNKRKRNNNIKEIGFDFIITHE